MKHHVHHHHHHHHHHDDDDRGDRGERRRRRGPGRGEGFGGRRRFEGDLDARIAFLEERQRDFEQAAADLAAKIQWLKERQARAATEAGARPADAPAPTSPAPASNDEPAS